MPDLSYTMPRDSEDHAGVRELFETNRCQKPQCTIPSPFGPSGKLSVLYKLYWLLLSLVSFYTLFSAASIVRRFPISNHRNDSTESSRIPLEARITNLRQIIAAMSFAFGALFFWALPGAFNTISDGRDWNLTEIIGAFRVHFAFAANVFLVLLLLHCVQWIVSRRVLGSRA